jgi:hypothetical protein
LFQSIGRGWTFLKQSWIFGQKNPVVLFPTLISLLASFLTLIITLLPVAGLIIYIRKNEWGQVAIGVALGLSLIILVAIINVLTIMTSNLTGTALSGKIPIASDAWKKLSDMGSVLYLMGLGLPAHYAWVALKSSLLRSSTKRSWENDAHLFIPILANEEVSFQQASHQIIKMQEDNSVFSAQGVGIRMLGILLTAGAMLIGLAAGLGVAWLVLNNGLDASQSRAMAFGLATLLVAIFTLPVALFCVYAVTLFNTCLYRWGTSVQAARGKSTVDPATVPTPLVVALGIRQGR